MLTILRERQAMRLGFIVHSIESENRIRALFPAPSESRRLLFMRLDSLDMTDLTRKYIEILSKTCDHLFLALDPGQMPDSIASVLLSWFPKAQRLDNTVRISELPDEKLNDSIKKAYNLATNVWIRNDRLDPCVVCGKETDIIDSCWHQPVCSEKCALDYEQNYSDKLRSRRPPDSNDAPQS